MALKLLKMLCRDSKQHHVMFHELYLVSSFLCIAQNVRFEIPYKVLYFETPFLMIFKYYAWASYGLSDERTVCPWYIVETFSEFSTEIFEKNRKRSNDLRTAFRQFGSRFCVFLDEIYGYSEFFTVSVKIPKI